MVDPEKIIACPSCKKRLRREAEALVCEPCGRSYPVAAGIPCLYPPDDRLTIDPTMLGIKPPHESARTIREMNELDHGFISRPRTFYFLYFLLLVTLVLQLWWPVSIIIVILLSDWFVFRRRRGSTLARYRASPLRLRTVADHRAVDEMYEREGKRQPSMSDWVELSARVTGATIGATGRKTGRTTTSGATGDANRSTAGDATGSASGDASGAAAGGTRGDEDFADNERYLDIRRVYDQYPREVETVVDVGANDGRATWRFGVGAGRTVVGIDVSHLLLQRFRENLPGQLALQADGACLPLADGCADFLFCTETLEHIPDPEAAVAEFLRVLKPGGWLMIQSPSAHRLRNLNPFHLLTLLASLVSDRVLQKKAVHENTWHNGITYHWDFSIQDYEGMIGRAGGTVIDLRSSQFFVPRFLLGEDKESFLAWERRLSRISGVRYFGGDLVVVAARSYD